MLLEFSRISLECRRHVRAGRQNVSWAAVRNYIRKVNSHKQSLAHDQRAGLARAASLDSFASYLLLAGGQVLPVPLGAHWIFISNEFHFEERGEFGLRTEQQSY